MNKVKIVIKKGVKNTIYFIFRFTKIENTIVFESSPDFSDNTKELFMYMLKQELNQKYKMIWLVEDKNQIKNQYKNVYFINYYDRNVLNLVRGLIHLSRAKFAFFSHRTPLLSPKKNQKFVNLWHGSGLKNTHFVDMSKNFTNVLNTSEKFNDPYINLLGCKKNQLLSLGNPRTDLFFDDNSLLRKKIKKDYNKVIIWMPTYRHHRLGGRVNFLESEKTDRNTIGLPIIQTIEDYHDINNLLKNLNILLIIKPHPAQDMSKLKIATEDNIMIIKNSDLSFENIDLYSFISISDALVTDYSSVYVDYLLMDKPIAFTVDDMDMYESGYTFEEPLEYMPGLKIRDLVDFKKFLFSCSNNTDEFIEDRKTINNLLNKYHDGNVSRRIVDYFDIM